LPGTAVIGFLESILFEILSKSWFVSKAGFWTDFIDSRSISALYVSAAVCSECKDVDYLSGLAKLEDVSAIDYLYEFFMFI
jgi:hypothetical protein